MSRATNWSCKCPKDGQHCDMIYCEHKGCLLQGQDAEPVSQKVSNTTANYTPTVRCHEGVHMILQVNKMRLWVGRGSSFGPHCPDGDKPWALMVNLYDDHIYGKASAKCNGEAAKFMSPELFEGEIPTVILDWPDFGIPKLSRIWWQKFVTDLQALDGDVALYCMGGHGRTGTAASILLLMMGAADDKGPIENPVEWLRVNYCDQVVESTAQINYIQEICDVKFHAEPRDNWTQGQSAFPLGNSTTTPLLPQGGTGSGKGKPSGKLGAANLSKNAFRKLWKRWGKGERPKHLVDGDEFEITDGQDKPYTYVWVELDKCFWIKEHMNVNTPGDGYIETVYSDKHSFKRHPDPGIWDGPDGNEMSPGKFKQYYFEVHGKAFRCEPYPGDTYKLGVYGTFIWDKVNNVWIKTGDKGEEVRQIVENATKSEGKPVYYIHKPEDSEKFYVYKQGLEGSAWTARVDSFIDAKRTVKAFGGVIRQSDGSLVSP